MTGNYFVEWDDLILILNILNSQLIFIPIAIL